MNNHADCNRRVRRVITHNSGGRYGRAVADTDGWRLPAAGFRVDARQCRGGLLRESLRYPCDECDNEARSHGLAYYDWWSLSNHELCGGCLQL